jgi:hypothetical protein
MGVKPIAILYELYTVQHNTFYINIFNTYFFQAHHTAQREQHSTISIQHNSILQRFIVFYSDVWHITAQKTSTFHHIF